MKQCRESIRKWIPALLSVLLVFGVLTVFGACGMKDDGTWMKCHGAQTTVAKLGGVMTALFLLAALLRNRALKTILYGLEIVGSVVVFLIPETIMPMCMMRTMRCYTVMQPFVRIMAVMIAVFAGISGMQALRQKQQEGVNVVKKRTVVIAAVVLIGITACVTGELIRSEAQKRARYEQAMRLADAGDTGAAYVLFAQLGNYRDAALQAERLIELDVLLPCRAAEKGDTVTFGRYEQDNNPGNGPEPIDWIVLDKVDGKLLLLSSACLAGKAYNAESFAPVTWETCSLRAWLGGEFFDSAFSEREREAVASVVNRNDDHSTVGTPGGKDTEDRVFLLSESDAVIYLNNDYDQDTIGRAMASDYAVANGLQTDEDGLCSWWLRSPGMYEYIAQFVDQKGKPYPNGGSTDIDYLFGVRPALWVDLDTADEGAAAQ